MHTNDESVVPFVRHGETTWKVEGRTQGQLDSPLTKKEISQARDLASQLRTEKLGVIISSPLGRAHQTASILAKELGVTDVRKFEHFSERSEGVFQGLTRAEQTERYSDCFAEETGRVITDLVPGVEPAIDFLRRVKIGAEEIGSISATTSIVVVTHAGVLQALVSLVTGEDLREVEVRLSFGFCEVVRFRSSELVFP